jgi:diguanylate cyclase (GGDEF)-like protein/PAS domain S-box-containing protein
MGNNIKNMQTEKGSGNGNNIFRDIVVSTNMLIWRTDAEGRFTFLNPAWEERCGYSEEEMLGKPFSDFQVPEAAEHYINEFRNCLIGESIIGRETTFYSKSGDETTLVINMIPLKDSTGTVTGTQGTAFDITERRLADELLQYISAKDELTGLYNLHTFLSMAGQQTKTAHRENKEMLIIYAGMDGMREINEEHSHQKGDLVLIDIANILRKTFREADVIARTSGDEFAVSTLVSSKNTEEMIMSRLSANIDKYNADKNGSLRVSLSFGTSFCNPDYPVTINEILSVADAKMHEHKQSKRN